MSSPYCHDGSVRDLGEAARLMTHHQLGRTLNPTETALIVSILRALTGELPTTFIAYPQGNRE
jgi:cytochrome c peroxidase